MLTSLCHVSRDPCTVHGRHQDAVFWVDIDLGIREGLKFHQTRSNAIILEGTLPAHGIVIVERLKTGEMLYKRQYLSPRPPPKISLKHDLNWTKENNQEVNLWKKDCTKCKKLLISKIVLTRISSMRWMTRTLISTFPVFQMLWWNDRSSCTPMRKACSAMWFRLHVDYLAWFSVPSNHNHIFWLFAEGIERTMLLKITLKCCDSRSSESSCER